MPSHPTDERESLPLRCRNPASTGIPFLGLKVLFGAESSAVVRFPSAEQSRSRAIPQVLITVVASNAPWQICCLAVDDDGAAGGEHGAGPGDGLVGAAEPGGCVGGGGDHGNLSRQGCGAVTGLQYSRLTSGDMRPYSGA